jgi:hypothetical protein
VHRVLSIDLVGAVTSRADGNVVLGQAQAIAR